MKYKIIAGVDSSTLDKGYSDTGYILKMAKVCLNQKSMILIIT